MKANILIQSVKVETPDGQAILILQVGINCPECGEYSFVVSGHHLRTLRDAIIQTIDGFPDLCGKEGQTAVVSRSSWAGRPPQDPNNN